MGGIAAIAAEAGYTVTGCDAGVYPPMSEQLAALGIDLIEGFDAGQLSIEPDYWVVGNVVSRGNPLMEAILDSGQTYFSGPQWLYEHVLASREVIAVAGTHGKTTTTAMLRHILLTNNLDTGWLVGGVPADGSASAAIGSDKRFVIEADPNLFTIGPRLRCLTISNSIMPTYSITWPPFKPSFITLYAPFQPMERSFARCKASRSIKY